MNRTTLALLIAPMWIPLGMKVYYSSGQSFGSGWIISAIYGFFGYLVSLAFGSSIVDFLRSRSTYSSWYRGSGGGWRPERASSRSSSAITSLSQGSYRLER